MVSNVARDLVQQQVGNAWLLMNPRLIKAYPEQHSHEYQGRRIFRLPLATTHYMTHGSPACGLMSRES
jgi:hypothetical protein